jgi:hypothetical protein
MDLRGQRRKVAVGVTEGRSAQARYWSLRVLVWTVGRDGQRRRHGTDRVDDIFYIDLKDFDAPIQARFYGGNLIDQNRQCEHACQRNQDVSDFWDMRASVPCVYEMVLR